MPEIGKVDCPHSNECSDYPLMCRSCRKNKGKKKSFYEPDTIPFIPMPYPYYPIEPVWCCKHE